MMRKTVFGWSDGGSACEYYRLRVPLEHLAETGRIRDLAISGKFQALVNPITGKGMLPDVVIVQRLNKPQPLIFLQMLHGGDFGKRPRLVYEVDDDLFNVPAHNSVAAHFASEETRRVMRQAMSLCDVITVSTEPLAEVIRRELWNFGVTDARIEVIPNALPHSAYRHDAPPSDWPITLGWAGSATHVEDFDEVAKPLGRFLRRNSDVDLHIICQHVFRSISKLVPGDQLKHTQWVRPMDAYYRALDTFDIGIIPLRPSVFNRSKSDIKFLEYAARRIPVIASPVGPYEMHTTNKLACPASTDPQWTEMLLGMVRTVGEGGKAELTENAFEYAWSRRVGSVASKWMEVINDA